MASFKQSRAKKGGETGKNGEFYPGGKFLPSTRLPKQTPGSKTFRVSKTLLVPGVLVDSRTWEGFGSIFNTISLFVVVGEDGKASRKFPVGHIAIQSHFSSELSFETLLLAYNNGERWYSLSESGVEHA